MSSAYWVFECTFVVNNNLLMGEVFIGATRKELLAAMQRFFDKPRVEVMLAEVLGAYLVEGGKVGAYFDAMPFLKVEIAKDSLSFDRESLAPVVGDLEGGGISRIYLAKGRAIAVDAEEEDEEDDEDPILKPFTFLFDAEGFLGGLPDRDGAPIAAKAELELVRPIGVVGFPEHCDSALYGPPVKVGPGWWDAEPSSKPKRFDPKERFVKTREVPMI